MFTSTTNSPHAKLRTLPLARIRITGGLWRQKQDVNHQITLLDGYRKLRQAGNFNNLELAAGRGTGSYIGPVFMDENVYKWLEAISYEIANSGDPQLIQMADETIALLADAQQADGYLNSYYQIAEPGRRWTDLDHGHELYCAGHLFQAAVAYFRATSQTSLLQIATRFADHIDSVFGPGRQQGTCGHPQIEMALVELYRLTRERRYLDLAGFFVDQRGQGRMRGYRSYGPEYHQDRVPVRQAEEVEGHAVRQLYLLSGVADLYLETGEQALFDAAHRLWRDATGRKMFITGGYGSRFEAENFGDAYELPSDSCYCETCASIASAMWNWRMLLATGEARFADHVERVLYNGFLSGFSHDGSHYFYVNPLQTRRPGQRSDWYGVACCPTNIMRQIASIGQYIATQDNSGLQIHQYVDAVLDFEWSNQPVTLHLKTDYPWRDSIHIDIQQSPSDSAWSLALRLPGWCSAPQIWINGERVADVEPGRYAALRRIWSSGDRIDLTLPMTPRWIQPHPRIDSVRGSVAVENGPLVYCLEDIDLPSGANLLDICADTGATPQSIWRPDILGGLNVVEVPGMLVTPSGTDDGLYQPLNTVETVITPLTLTAMPYYAWANRGPAAMRVWIPRG